METLAPEIVVILDLAGLGMTLWLGLHLITHAWGWHQGSARPAALVLWSLALVFALAAYDGLAPVSGATVEGGLLRLLLWPLPLTWLLFAYRLTPAGLRARYGIAAWLVVLLGLVTLGVAVATLLLVPEWLGHSWLYLPAYSTMLLAAMVATVTLAFKARRITSGTEERRAKLFLIIASLFALVGGVVLAAHLVFGSANPVAQVTELPYENLRIAGTMGLLGAAFFFSLVVVLQARAAGAPHVSGFAHSLLVTLVMTVLYLTVGGMVVWYWELPQALLALFLLLALMTDMIDNATRSGIERWLYRGETGQLRRKLRQVADHMEMPLKVPPAVRPQLTRLARQINSHQLGLALREGNEFRVVAAVRPSWEGKVVDVRDPNVWEERGLSGWNLPLKNRNGQTLGVLASESTGTLSRVQRQLLNEAVAEIVQLLEEWQEVAKKREALQKLLDEFYAQHEQLDAKLITLSAPAGATADLRRRVAQAFRHYKEPGRLVGALGKLKVVDRMMGPGQQATEGRAQVVRDILSQLVEQLRPFEGEPPATSAPEWRPYLVLRRVHIEGKSEDEVAQELGIKKRALAQARGAGIEAIANLLSELESGAARKPAWKKEPSAPAPAPSFRAGSPARAPERPAIATPPYGGGVPPATPGSPPLTTPSYGGSAPLRPPGSPPTYGSGTPGTTQGKPPTTTTPAGGSAGSTPARPDAPPAGAGGRGSLTSRLRPGGSGTDKPGQGLFGGLSSRLKKKQESPPPPAGENEKAPVEPTTPPASPPAARTQGSLPLFDETSSSPTSGQGDSARQAGSQSSS